MQPEQLPAVAAAPADNLADLLTRQARLQPARLAYAMLGDDLSIAQSLTFGELARGVPVLAQALLRRAQPGDTVLLAFSNGLPAIEAFWACIVAGLVPIPGPAPDSSQSRVALDRLAGIAANAQIVLALTGEEAVAGARRHLPELPWHTASELLAVMPPEASWRWVPAAQADSLAYLQYTSGSTSEPRGVELTHAAVLAQCEALAVAVPVDAGEARGLIWLPWFHDYGLIHALVQPMYAGAASLLMPTLTFMRRPLRWLSAVETHRITHIGAPNFAYAACTQALARNPDWSARLDSLQVASCGAEPVRRDTLEAFAAAFAPHGFNPRTLAPSYGLAEAVLVATLTRVGQGPHYLQVASRALGENRVEPVPDGTPGATQLVSCGAPLPGFQVRIVQPDNRKVCAPGQVGEIWIRGPSLGRGYRGNPEASADFHAGVADDPAAGDHLRTGDLGFLYEGELYITGRRKDLLVVHGRNVYPQDLEATAGQAHPDVREAGVIAIGVSRPDGKDCVVLLVECRGRPMPPQVTQLADQVRRDVTAGHEVDVLEVVPVRSGTLPRTSSGKPQRAAARRMYLQGELAACRLETESGGAALVQPVSDDIIRRVRAVWAEVLGGVEPSDDEDFFARGGDSLLATQVVSRLSAALGIELPVRVLFEASTPAGLARLTRAAVSAASSGGPDPAAGQPAHTVSAAAAQLLSFAQERMWFMYELAPESPAYNVPLAVRLRGPLDVGALQQAIANVVARHDILRSTFKVTPDGPRAEVQLPGGAVPLIEMLDLRTGHDEPERVARGLMAGLASRPFILQELPLWRVSLLRLADDDYLMLWVMHHIISDQWSCAVLGREIAVAYRAAAGGATAALPPPALQYADYSLWYRRWFSGERYLQQLTYWRDQLAGLQPFDLPTDFPRPRQQGFGGAAVRRPLDPMRLQQLIALGAAHGASLSMVLLTALKMLLHRYSGATDIAVGVPIANRHHLAAEDLPGTMVNTLVLRTDLTGDPDFTTGLNRVRRVALDAYEHQDMPFELLVKELDLAHDLSRSPLFDVLFNMINTPVRDINFTGMHWSRFDFDRGAAQFDLVVNVDAHFDHAVVFEYATDLFAAETVERMADHYLRILDSVIEAPQVPVGSIRLLSSAERDRLRRWGQGPEVAAVEWPARVFELLQPACHAGATAVVCGDETLSYAELEAQSNQLAALLRARGLGRGSTVGLCLPRATQLPVALLAVLKSGAAYVPLDPAFPSERLQFQAQDAGIGLLLADSSTVAYLDWPREATLLLDREGALLTQQSPAALRPHALLDARAQDPAYVIYTSGSTGTPKGVVVPHRAVVNFLCSMRRQPGLSANDRLLAVTTPGFDIAVLELLLPMTVGACAVLASDTEAASGRLLAELLQRHRITLMQATPSRWHLLLDSGWCGQAGLRALVGGESLSSLLAGRLLDCGLEVWNMYGPTETTVWSTCGRVQATAAAGAVPLGRPVANTTVQILDAAGQPCPVGVPGEICIGGRGLAVGYLGQPELTARQFIAAPAGSLFADQRLYRTGDLGRWSADGQLLHLGRLDDQIKLRGYRIEPGEIEACLLRHAAVSRSVVALREDVPGDPHLVAWVVPVGDAPEVADLRAHLRAWLPEHMLPRHIVVLVQLPTLPNGKINRRALPAPLTDPLPPRCVTPPATGLQRALLEVWQQVLEREDIGIHDNFFDVGGHSIMAVRLMQQVATELGQPCPLALLFHSPTVAELAAALESGAAVADKGVLVELLSGGMFPALFCLSGRLMYRELAAQMEASMRVYGLVSAAEINLLHHGERLPPVTELARLYREGIQRLQPAGPYRLAGFSIGGLIAFEVAQQLRAQGERVELLALIDTAAPGFGYRHVLRWLQRRWAQLRRDGFAAAWRALQGRRKAARSGVAGDQSGLSPHVFPEYARIARAYQAADWPDELLFVQAADDPVREPGYGWKRHAPELRVATVPGGHMDLIRATHVMHTARYLARSLASIMNRTDPVDIP